MRPVRDYSRLDLTQFATHDAAQEMILPGDRLVVTLDPGTLEKDAEHVWNVSVDETGQTSLPNIGPVRLAGLNNSEAEQAIVQTSLQRDVFLTPVVEVKLAERRQKTLMVSGAVGQPGEVEIPESEVTLADVIVRARGLSKRASGVVTISGALSEPMAPGAAGSNTILPVSSSRQLTAKSIQLAESTPEQLAQIQIPEGATVHFEELPEQTVTVVGVIRDQAIQVPAGRDLRLLDAIAAAGGQTYSNWISDRITITRRVPGNSNEIRIAASIRKARNDTRNNLLLAPDDIVTVEENLVTFTLSTLSGLFGAGVSAAQMGAL